MWYNIFNNKTMGCEYVKPFETAEYLVRLLNPADENELRKVQRLRYRYLLAEFDERKNDPEGLDDDGFDAFSDSILVIDKETGEIVGTYRTATEETLKERAFKSEKEFDISALKTAPGGVVEASRAVVHPDCRSGVVIGLLWKALISYAEARDKRYIIGTCSLHGTDPGLYEDCTSVLRRRYLFEDCEIKAVRQAFEYGRSDIPEEEATMPKLLGMYLKFGAKTSQNGFIDYAFNCCDVLTVLDREKIDRRLYRFIMR